MPQPTVHPKTFIDCPPYSSVRSILLYTLSSWPLWRRFTMRLTEWNGLNQNRSIHWSFIDGKLVSRLMARWCGYGGWERILSSKTAEKHVQITQKSDNKWKLVSCWIEWTIVSQVGLLLEYLLGSVDGCRHPSTSWWWRKELIKLLKFQWAAATDSSSTSSSISVCLPIVFAFDSIRFDLFYLVIFIFVVYK